MKIINASANILFAPEDAYHQIETHARLCYKSEDKVGPGSDVEMVRKLVARGHWPMFDHVHVSVRFVVDRGVSHELVRHRLCAFAQESTRYCNYSKGKFGGELTFIEPPFWPEGWQRYADARGMWTMVLENAELAYLELISLGHSPQEARSVLPNSLKTEIDVTANFTEWRHIFKLRTSKAAHPQMREVMVPLLAEFIHRWPEVFEDIRPEV